LKLSYSRSSSAFSNAILQSCNPAILQSAFLSV
jgi:hypothetical protein